MEGSTELYRYFDNDGSLLYIGISLSAVARAVQHRQNAHWWDKVHRCEVERFPTRALAADAERKAIKAERPLHNVVHNGGERSPALPVAIASDDIVGLWFLDGETGHQGMVQTRVAEGYYVVQFFSWINGNPTSATVVTLDEICGWKLFEDFESFDLVAQRYIRQQARSVGMDLSA